MDLCRRVIDVETNERSPHDGASEPLAGRIDLRQGDRSKRMGVGNHSTASLARGASLFLRVDDPQPGCKPGIRLQAAREEKARQQSSQHGGDDHRSHGKSLGLPVLSEPPHEVSILGQVVGMGC